VATLNQKKTKLFTQIVETKKTLKIKNLLFPVGPWCERYRFKIESSDWFYEGYEFIM